MGFDGFGLGGLGIEFWTGWENWGKGYLLSFGLDTEAHCMLYFCSGSSFESWPPFIVFGEVVVREGHSYPYPLRR